MKTATLIKRGMAMKDTGYKGQSSLEYMVLITMMAAIILFVVWSSEGRQSFFQTTFESAFRTVGTNMNTIIQRVH